MTAMDGWMEGSRRWFVRHVYADHNDAPAVQAELSHLLSVLDRPDTVGINVGSGTSRLHPRITNVDLLPHENVDVVANAERLPFGDASVDLVVSQEAVEHVADPFLAVREMARVLRPGGIAYVQTPFVIGYHPGPTDFWRFSVEGIRRLVEQAGLEVIRIAPSVGPGTGFYRIAVELLPSAAAMLSPRAYLPTKGATALLLSPLKLLDRVLAGTPQIDRIAGGYFVVARKPA